MTGTYAPRPRIPADELRALVTVETVERLVGKVAQAISAEDTHLAFALLGAIVDETTARTATAVKTQGASDYIAAQAGGRVRATLARVQAELDAEDAAARRLEAEHEAATERSIAEHEADLASRLDY